MDYIDSKDFRLIKNILILHEPNLQHINQPGRNRETKREHLAFTSIFPNSSHPSSPLLGEYQCDTAFVCRKTIQEQ